MYYMIDFSNIPFCSHFYFENKLEFEFKLIMDKHNFVAFIILCYEVNSATKHVEKHAMMGNSILHLINFQNEDLQTL